MSNNYEILKLIEALKELTKQTKRIADAIAPKEKDSIDAPDD